MARIIVADDDDGVRAIIAACCELDDHEVAAFATTADALDAFAASRPDLVILDKNMIGGGAAHFLAEVERLYGGAACPVIVVTGDAPEDVGLQAVDTVIQKPFNIDALRLAVKSALRA